MRISFQPTHLKFFHFTLALICQFVHYLAPQWLPNSILLGTIALQTFGLCPPFLSFQTWLVTIWPPLSLQRQLLRLSFVHMMRRNLTSGSTSSRLCLQRQGSNPKNSNTVCHCSGQPAQASPPGHFGHTRCLQWLWWVLRLFENHFAWPVLKEQVAVNYFASPLKCRASSPVFSWGSSNSISLQEFPLTTIFFSPCFWFAYRLPCEKR